MEQQNKEFPSFPGQESAPQDHVEHVEQTEAVVETQPNVLEQDQQVSQSDPVVQEIIHDTSPAESPFSKQPEASAAIVNPEEIDHAAHHLQKENNIETSADASEIVNAIMSGKYKI